MEARGGAGSPSSGRPSPMAEPLGWCVQAVRAAAEPALSRALLALRSRHTRRAGGVARFRERGGLAPLLELLGPQRPRRTLDLALSVLGNCCTERGSRRAVRRLGGIQRLVALLSSPGPESVLNRAARTIANLALEPDGARDVLEAGAVPLLISLSASCSTPECLHSSSRALRILASSSPSHRRALCRAGAARAVASRLAALPPSHPACPAVASALRGLTDGDAADADDIVPALPVLTALALHAKRDRRQPALAAIANACSRAALRPALGAAGAVEAVTEEVKRALASPNAAAGAAVAVRALCLLCREAVNRARVRAAGGLALLPRLLAVPAWRYRVLVALAAFAYDQEALAALEERGVVPLLADVLRARADEERDDNGGGDGDEEDEEAASFDLPRDDGDAATRDGAAAGSLRGLNFSFSGLGSSPLRLRRLLLLLSLPPPLLRRRRPLRAAAAAVCRRCGRWRCLEGWAKAILGSPKRRRCCSWVAWPPAMSRAALWPPPLSSPALLRYLTGVRSPAPRAARLLHRLAAHPALLGGLVRGYVPSLIRAWLVLGVDPNDHGFATAAPGPRRQRLRELGEALLRTLGGAAGTPFGLGLLTRGLRCGDPPVRLACATALPLLARCAGARALLGASLALLVAAVSGGSAGGEAPPGFALYAADAIGILRKQQAFGDTAEDLWGQTDVRREPRGQTDAPDVPLGPSRRTVAQSPLRPLSPKPPKRRRLCSAGTSPPPSWWPHVGPAAPVTPGEPSRGQRTFSQPSLSSSEPPETFSEPSRTFSEPPETFSEPSRTFSE
ncbi:armadillo repeat-containing protein 5, partial [Cuculus canorus]|uniref:armadillo repeat-containing protein 5 n=1 Tax=Cuculus canorus TaxID=55661 RepID=UPI0023AAED52